MAVYLQQPGVKLRFLLPLGWASMGKISLAFLPPLGPNRERPKAYKKKSRALTGEGLRTGSGMAFLCK